MNRMTLAAGAFEAMVAHARREAPRECCGVLIGRGGDILEAIATANLADSADRFLIDPRAHILARRDARSRGLDVLGFYHSHPHSAAVPSPSDLAEAAYDACYAIVSLESAEADVRLYQFAEGRFEEAIVATDPRRARQAGS